MGKAEGSRRATRNRLRYALFALALTCGLACATVAPGRYANTVLPPNARIDRLVVYKSDQNMTAYSGDVLLKTYRVQTGFSSGPKRWEGDKRTPEGTYRIDARYPSKKFHRFLHVSYPNADDTRTYLALKRAKEVPAGAGVGSAIGIHGVSRDTAGAVAANLGLNWTAGCIAVTDAEIEELYRTVVPGARLEIKP